MIGAVRWCDRRGRITDGPTNVTGSPASTASSGGPFLWNLVNVETDADEYGLREAVRARRASASSSESRSRRSEPVRCGRGRRPPSYAPVGGSLGYPQAAVSGIGIALQNAVGTLLGLPVYQLLGGKCRDSAQSYADCHAGEGPIDL